MFELGLLLTALLLAVGHWFPWPHPLPRLVAYVYGVGALLAGQLVWLLAAGRGGEWLRLAQFAAVGGLVTLGCYGIDAGLNAWLRRRHERHS